MKNTLDIIFAKIRSLLRENYSKEELAEEIYRITSKYDGIPNRRNWNIDIKIRFRELCVEYPQLKELGEIFNKRAENNPEVFDGIDAGKIFKALGKGCE